MESQSPRAPIVWLVNEGGHDYTTLEKYGRVMPFTRGSVNPFNLDRQMVHLGPRLQSASEDDYVAVSGLPILNALVVAMWLAKFQKVNLLQWSMKKETYVPIVLTRAAVEKNANESGKPAD
jgi:hypothetical protein